MSNFNQQSLNVRQSRFILNTGRKCYRNAAITLPCLDFSATTFKATLTSQRPDSQALILSIVSSQVSGRFPNTGLSLPAMEVAVTLLLTIMPTSALSVVRCWRITAHCPLCYILYRMRISIPLSQLFASNTATTRSPFADYIQHSPDGQPIPILFWRSVMQQQKQLAKLLLLPCNG